MKDRVYGQKGEGRRNIACAVANEIVGVIEANSILPIITLPSSARRLTGSPSLGQC